MSDLISRTWLLAEYDKRHKGPPGGARKLIEEAPPAEPHWIPVTEEPKESGKYLVTAVISFIPDHVDDPNTYEAVTTANYSADTRDPIKWWGNNVEKVLAWMPLPEPMGEGNA